MLCDASCLQSSGRVDVDIYLDACKKSCLKVLLSDYFGYVCHLRAVAFGVSSTSKRFPQNMS